MRLVAPARPTGHTRLRAPQDTLGLLSRALRMRGRGVIELSEFGPLEQIPGRARTAVVHKVDYRIPNDPLPLVFKELLPETELKALGFAREALVREIAVTVGDSS